MIQDTWYLSEKEMLGRQASLIGEQVINKIDTERFFQSLDDTEWKIVIYKLIGLMNKEIILEL